MTIDYKIVTFKFDYQPADKNPSHLLVILIINAGGDLFDAITVAQKFSEEKAALMINHLVSALAYLHNLNIVHRDVKPENLLVEFDGENHFEKLQPVD
ncbi:serine/threonine-protein kinase DCLK1-like [Tribolium madens]|uniref:serine/threonine-protein kinase DCLK1-like n=1 Tax=Tribolium madens TaxID=41895 RepID=UPI001CF741CB|nr:serine/threonine-protein kinase DCLK1-like [Tribolium madens]